jgi:hypothetical protein
MTFRDVIEGIEVLREIKLSEVEKKIFLVTDCPMAD